MKMARGSALALLCTLAFLGLFRPETAQAQYLIGTGSDLCLGMSSGTDVVTKACRAGFTVTPEFPTDRPQVAILRVANPDGRTGCIDGYKGMSGGEGWLMVEACDGTTEQLWYLYDEGYIQNEATQMCVDIAGANRGRNADLINFTCTWEWNQTFSWKQKSATGGVASASVLASPNANSYLSPDGAGILSHNGGTLVGNDGASMVAAGAGNLVGNDGASMVAAGAGNVVPTGAGGMVAAGAGNAVPTYGLAGGVGQQFRIGNYCLDGSGSELALADCNAASRFTYSTAGEIRVHGTDRCIDGWRGRNKVGHEEDGAVREPAVVYTCDNSAEQQWQQHLNTGGQFFLRNAQYGLCMDIDGGVVEAGRKVLLWKCYDPYRPANQVFTIS